MSIQHDLTRGRDKIAQRIKKYGSSEKGGSARPTSEQAHNEAAKIARLADKKQREQNGG